MTNNENINFDMLDGYEPELVDLDGETYEVIDAITYENINYVALVPYVEDMDDDEDSVEFVILKEVEKDGEYFLSTIDDDDLYTIIGDLFIEHFEEVFEEIEE